MIHVGFVIDNNYVKYCSVVIASILKNAKNNDNYCFHIINDNSITEESKKNLEYLKKIKNFEIKYYPQNKQLHHEQRKDTRQDIPMVTNYRLMISSILKDIDKIIFMDADLVIASDLSELWNIDIDKYYIAACDTTYDTILSYKKTIDIPDNYEYCNTGVMLANLRKWREDNIEVKLFESEKKYRGLYQFYDQCIFNITMFDKILYLDQKFNFRPANWRDLKWLEMFSNGFHPVVIHWASKIKPWNCLSEPFADEFWKNAQYTTYYYQLICEQMKNDLINRTKNENLGINSINKNSFLESIFSMKNEYKNNIKHKIITILGIKIKLKTTETRAT